MFGGQLRSRVECTACGSVSLCFDPFLDISVPIPDAHKQVNPKPEPLQHGRRDHTPRDVGTRDAVVFYTLRHPLLTLGARAHSCCILLDPLPFSIHISPWPQLTLDPSALRCSSNRREPPPRKPPRWRAQGSAAAARAAAGVVAGAATGAAAGGAPWRSASRLSRRPRSSTTRTAPRATAVPASSAASSACPYR